MPDAVDSGKWQVLGVGLDIIGFLEVGPDGFCGSLNNVEANFSQVPVVAIDIHRKGFFRSTPDGRGTI